MNRITTLVLAAILVASAGTTHAQVQSPPAAADPVLLSLPMGATVRLAAKVSPGQWTKGVLVSADSASVAIVPEGAPVLGANQLRLPSASVARFELKTGSRRQWLYGLLIGAALGVVVGATAEVDEVACEVNEYYGFSSDYYFCSRGEAIAYSVLGSGALGAGIGALVKTDRWTPVALDALAPPAPRVSGVKPRLRVRPGGGIGLDLAVGF